MRLIALFTVLAMGACGSPIDRKTIFLDKMGGFETYIEKAAAKQELKIEIIEEAEHPDLKVMLGKKFTSVYAEVLYKKQTGRTEDSRLSVVDVKTKKELLTHDFRMGSDDESKQRAADEFVRKLNDALK